MIKSIWLINNYIIILIMLNNSISFFKNEGYRNNHSAAMIRRFNELCDRISSVENAPCPNLFW